MRLAPVFSKLDDEQLRMLLEAMHRRSVSPGPLLRQGESGDAMLVIIEGQLKVSYQPHGGCEVVIDQIGPGEVLGELSCCDPAPLACSVNAEVPSVVYQLDRNLLDTLRNHAPQLASAVYGGLIECVCQRSKDLESRIVRSSGSLRRLGARIIPAQTRQSVQSNLDHTRIDGVSQSDIELFNEIASARCLSEEELLFTEGQPGDACYIIVDGQIDVLRGPKGRFRRLCTLGAGALVGQMALIHQAPRSATVRALTAAKVLKIDAQLFRRLLASEQDFALRFQERITVAAIRQHRRILERLDGVFQLSVAEQRSNESKIDDALERTLSDHAAGLRELSISPDELDQISVVVPTGQLTTAEIKARLGR